MRFALNIGMRTSEHYGLQPLSLSRVCLELHDAGFTPVTFEVKNPRSAEPTAVFVVFDMRPLGVDSARQRLDWVAQRLQQDCIAVVPLYPSIQGWGHDWKGAQLIGPRAAAWGAFDRTLFIPADINQL